MMRRKQLFISVGCVALLLVSWVIIISAKSTEERQIELMHNALLLMQDGIYVLAVPILEDAAEYSTKHTLAIEAELKRAYLALADTHGYRSRYLGLLEKQLGRRDASAEIFMEAASYYLNTQRTTEAFEVFRDGIERTGCQELIRLYESNRYIYEINRTGYDFASAIHNNAARVQKDGAWGMAAANGSPMIPCAYEQISTFDSDRAIVRKNGEIFAVNADNNRIALLCENLQVFGTGFSENRFPLLIDGAWHRATGDFVIGASSFEELGMYFGGYVAAKQNGRWGVIDKEMNWLIPPEHGDIIRDELGRSYAQGAVFVRNGTSVSLYIDGSQATGIYEDAKPFSNEGFAAVRSNGKWGFIDNYGSVVIDFTFDDALSFGQHLAAVRVGDLWGYINREGNIVIEPLFLEAKSFQNGSAPVLTERGWDFITLIEYRNGK
jgi:tetratricopeptide (TPR) repeat protein